LKLAPSRNKPSLQGEIILYNLFILLSAEDFGERVGVFYLPTIAKFGGLLVA